MPIFLDRHDVVESSAEEIAKLHLKDLEAQGKYGVKRERFSDLACQPLGRRVAGHRKPQQLATFVAENKSGFSKLILRIRSRTSLAMRGRPPGERDFYRQ
jgi:hypothetical protein